MKAELILAIGLLGFAVGLSPSAGQEPPGRLGVGQSGNSAALVPVVSASEYKRAHAEKLWASYGDAANAENGEVVPASAVEDSAEDDEVPNLLPQVPVTAAAEPSDSAEPDGAPSDANLSAPPEDPFTDEGVSPPSAEADSAGRSLEQEISPAADETLGSTLETVPGPHAGMGMGGMELACGTICIDDCRARPCCLPHWRTFGDFLMMRPTNAEVPFAETINGPIVQPPAVPLQVSPIATVEPDFKPGVRVGISRVFADCSDITLTYSHLETDSQNAVVTQPPLVIRSLVRHPGDQTAAIDNLAASARYDIAFQLVDLDFRDVWKSCPTYSISYLVGARYGHLSQAFDSRFSSLGVETVSTRVDFDGGGLRVGLEGQRRIACSGWSVYGRGVANFLGGEFSGTYLQDNNFAGTVVDTSWKAQRIVSILDLEAGVQYTCCDGCVNLAAGYAFSGWYNTVTTEDFIRSVQTNNFDELSNILGFEGFVVRAEVRF